MSDLVIEDLDSVYIKVNCERSIAKELNQYFTFAVPNYQFTPAYKNKIWDGQIRLFNLFTHTIYAGLLDYVIKFANDRNYTIEYPQHSDKNYTEEQVAKYVEEFIRPTASGKRISAHDYQIKAITHAIQKERTLLLCPTGSGKSLIIYCLMRFFLDHIKPEKKILVVVPTVGLVSQMYSDFEDYSKENKWSVGRHCYTISSGKEKDTHKRVVISTWQSIYKMPKEFFDQFDMVVGDECHLFKAKSLSSLMSKLTSCPIRVGTTGTLDGTHTHKLVVEGLFGRVLHVTTTATLIEKNLLSNLSIDCILLQYSDRDIEEAKRMLYKEEIKWIILNNKRNKFIKNLCSSLKGNTLVLFNFVELHGKPLYDMFKQQIPDKDIYCIHGGTDVDQREEIRKVVDRSDNSILLASYGTCSTGINIRNIHNVVFASPSKSVVRVLQSIGRGLRKSETKTAVNVYDIGDDLRHKKYRNHSLNHMDERIRIYTKEKFKYKLVSLQLKEN
jgi:superfamily II DNA or RNA helicase